MAEDLKRWEKWFELWLETGDAVEAAKACGYARPSQAAKRLLAQPRVSAALEEAAKNKVMRREELLMRAAVIARGHDIRQSDRYGDVYAGPAPATEQGKMIKLLMQVEGMLVEKREHSHAFKGSVNVTIPDNGRGDRLPDG